MSIKTDGFQWDQGNLTKCQKHGVSPDEIESFFQGEVRVIHDLKHSHDEPRYIALGYGSRDRPMFVAFALRQDREKVFIRPISARYMRAKELKKYEKASSKV